MTTERNKIIYVLARTLLVALLVTSIPALLVWLVWRSTEDPGPPP